MCIRDSIPPLLLIVFVENAFKHGVSYNHASFIHIRIGYRDDAVTAVIRELTQIEYGILKAFMSNVGRALSRDDILEMVWGHHYVGELKIVDVNIRRLRIKIEDNPASPRYIVTVRGFGYMWEG